jgi:hypothetical protein
MVEGFVEMIAVRNATLGEYLMDIDAPLEATSALLRQKLPKLSLDQDTIDFIDSGMPQIWPWLAKLMRQPCVPDYMEECRWIVEAVTGQSTHVNRAQPTWQHTPFPVLVAV